MTEPIEIRRLSNGITVVAERQTYLKTCAFGVWIHVGSSNETEKNNGISHVIEHMLFKGTKNRTARDIADIIAAIGDDVNAYTTKEYTTFYGTTLTEYLSLLVELLADMLFHSKFDIEDLEREKSVILDEIDLYHDSPEDLVHEQLQEAVWSPHPLSFLISGKKDVVRTFTADSVLAFMEQYYIPKNIVLSLAGNYTEDIFEQLENLFSKNVCTKTQEYVKRTSVSVPYTKSFIYEKQKIEQLHINLCYPTVPSEDPQKYLITVFNSAFGGSNNSRLFQEIREKLGLAYSVFSYGSAFEKAGLFHIDITVNPKQSEEALQRILGIIETIREHGFYNQELSTHRKQVITELIMSSESAKSKMSFNAKSVARYGRVVPLEETIERVKTVTEADAQQFVVEYLKKEACSISIVGNLSSKNEQILRKIHEKA